MLRWSNNATGCGNRTNSVYFGTSNQPAFLVTLPGSSTSTTATISSTPGTSTTYYWKVVVSDGVQFQSSQTFNFIACFAQAPGVSQLLFPANNSRITASSVQLRWSPTSPGQSCGPSNFTYYLKFANSTAAFVDPTAVIYTGLNTVFNVSVSPDWHFWKVVSGNGGLTSPSAVYSFQSCKIASPTPPAWTVSADVKNTSNVLLQWNASSKVGESCTGSSTLVYTIYGPQGPLASTSSTSVAVNLNNGNIALSLVASNSGVSSNGSNITISVCSFPAPVALQPSQGSTVQNGTIEFLTGFNWGMECALSNRNGTITIRNSSGTPVIVKYSYDFLTSFKQSLDQGSYSWHVSATSNGITKTSSLVSFTVAGSCIAAPPGSVTVSQFPTVVSSQNSLVTLQWNSSGFGTVCGASNNTFVVFLDGNSLPSTPIGKTLSNSLMYNCSALSSNKTYYWRVAAYNGANSSYSNSSSFLYCTPVAPIAVFTAPAVGSHVPLPFLVSWNLTDFGRACTGGSAITYTLYTSATLNFNGARIIYRGSDLFTNVDSVQGVVNLKLVVENSDGASSNQTLQFNTCIPSTAQSITVIQPVNTILSTNQVTFSWNDTSTCDQAYWVAYSSSSRFGNYLNSSQLQTRQWSTTLAEGQWYWLVYVTVKNYPQFNVTSSISTFGVCVPSTPSVHLLYPAENATAILATSVAFSWNLTGSDCTQKLKIEFSIENSTALLVKKNYGFYDTQLFVGSPNAVGWYRWNVTIYNGSTVISTQTRHVFACAASPPPVPLLLTPTNGSTVTSGTNLLWSAVNFGACALQSTYKLRFSRDPNPSFYGLINGTSAMIDAYTSSGVYYWAVEAFNGVYYSNASTIWMVSVCSPTPPSLPIQISPSANSVSAQSTVTFEFGSISSMGQACSTLGDEVVQLQVDFGNGTFTTVNTWSNVTLSGYTFSHAFANGNYSWRVLVTNIDRITSTSSEIPFIVQFGQTGASQTSQSSISVFVVSNPMVFTTAVVTGSFVQNSGTTLTLSGGALTGVAISAGSVTLNGNLVIDLTGVDAYSGMQILLVNATLLTGSWQSVSLSGTSSECSVVQADVSYQGSSAVATLTVVQLCTAGNVLAWCVAALMILQ